MSSVEVSDSAQPARPRRTPRARDQHPPATGDVGQRAAGEQERGERDGVRGDHALQLGDPGVEVALQVAQGHRDDGVVERRRERRERRGHEHEARRPRPVTLSTPPLADHGLVAHRPRSAQPSGRARTA
jgi:hypothetical protein